MKQPVQHTARPVEARRQDNKTADKPEPTNEKVAGHIKAVRDLAQEIRNRNDQDTNKIVDNMLRHLEAIDGDPDARKAEELEAEKNRAAAERRSKLEADRPNSPAASA